MGTVEVGKTADLVLLDGNPVASVANLHRVRGVMHDGRYYDAAALDGLRKQIADAQR